MNFCIMNVAHKYIKRQTKGRPCEVIRYLLFIIYYLLFNHITVKLENDFKLGRLPDLVLSTRRFNNHESSCLTSFIDRCSLASSHNMPRWFKMSSFPPPFSPPSSQRLLTLYQDWKKRWWCEKGSCIHGCTFTKVHVTGHPGPDIIH